MSNLVPYRCVTLETYLSSEDLVDVFLTALRPLPPYRYFFLYPVYPIKDIEYSGKVSREGFRIRRLYLPTPPARTRGLPVPKTIAVGKFFPVQNHKTKIELVIRLPISLMKFSSPLFLLLCGTLFISIKSWITTSHLEVVVTLGVLFILLLACYLLVDSFNDEADQIILFVNEVIKSAEKDHQD